MMARRWIRNTSVLLSSKKNRGFRYLRALDDVVRVYAATGRHRLVRELRVRSQRNLTVVRILRSDPGLSTLGPQQSGATLLHLDLDGLVLLGGSLLRSGSSLHLGGRSSSGTRAGFLTLMVDGFRSLFGSNGTTSDNSSSRFILSSVNLIVRFGLGGSDRAFLPLSVALGLADGAAGFFWTAVAFFFAAGTFSGAAFF